MLSAEQIKKLESMTVYGGGHQAPPEGGEVMGCAVELAAHLAGEAQWSDHPQCVCPVIAAFVRPWNDRIKDDERRTRIMREVIPVIVGTRSTRAVEKKRGWLAVDWSLRVRTPTLMRRTPALVGLADRFAALPEIVDYATLAPAQEIIAELRALRNQLWKPYYERVAELRRKGAAEAAAAEAAEAAAAAEAAGAAEAGWRCSRCSRSQGRRRWARGPCRSVRPGWGSRSWLQAARRQASGTSGISPDPTLDRP